MTLDRGAEIILKQCMGVKEGETVLIVTDNNKKKMGNALYKKAEEMNSNSSIIIYKPAEISGTEPPLPVAAAMKEADVVICPTTASLTHTNARLEAVENGVRVATMPGITEAMFSKGPIQADYREVSKLSDRVAELLTKADEARIITDGKYELVLSLTDREGVSSPGIYKEAGQSGNLPSGEGYIAPVEDSANGKLLVDGSIVGIGKLGSPVVLNIKQGKLYDVEGKAKENVEKAIPDNYASRLIGELGIGTNPAASVTGIILEDEKVYGTVHIAFGTNITFGGENKAESHIDCVTLKPTLYLDDKLLIQNGKFKL